ncbi:MAG: MBL fold metallo-hydrolase RNA specificity domain-containing protein [Candidatus Anstonellales archaeon]
MNVSFYGGAGEVGRSAIEVHDGQKHILIDCGVKLGAETQIPSLDKDFFRRVSNIVISHAHLDHIGFLPFLYLEGFSPTLYGTKPTFELAKLLLEDYSRISKAFSVREISRVLSSAVQTPFMWKIKSSRFPSFSLLHSGHILGSAMVKIEEEGGILYTGDFRVRAGKILEGCVRKIRARTLIMEGTYGLKSDKLPTIQTASRALANSVRKTLEGGGIVLIPSFAVGRGQEILLVLEDYMRSGFLPQVPIYVDGMIKKANKIYSKYVDYFKPEIQRRTKKSHNNPFSSSLFKSASPRNRSKILSSPCIIVSTSGMLTGGPVLEYLKAIGSSKKNKLIFVGYQAEGTLGRRIQDGERFVQIDGEEHYLNLEVETVRFSAHADHDDLVRFANGIKGLKKIFLVHGEVKKLNELMSDLKQFEVAVPNINETFKV